MNNTTDTKQEQSATHDSVVRGTDIQSEVRNIVVDALSDGKMEPEQIKDVLRSVTQGALEGASLNSQFSKDALQKTISGVDDALSHVAEASKLAIEEAASKIDEYSDHDLKKAMTDLKDLEEMFFQTLTEVAKSGQEATYHILDDLLNHARQSSTSVGSSISDALSQLQNLLSNTGSNIHAADAAKATGTSVAKIASGILAGIAESISPKDKS